MGYQVELAVKPEEKKRMTSWTMPKRHKLSAAWGDMPPEEFKEFSQTGSRRQAEARTETIDGVAKTSPLPSGVDGADLYVRRGDARRAPSGAWPVSMSEVSKSR